MPGDPQTHLTLPKISPKFSSPKKVADSLAEDSESISRRPLTPTSSHRYESQKLQWKHSTKEVEENIQTMMNRVAYLQHEESRLVSQIESTKQKATEILRVRKKHRQHVERLVGVKLTRERRIQKNKAQAASMRENLRSNVERSKSLSATDRLSLAEDTRSQMEGLYDRFHRMKRDHRDANIEKANNQKDLEEKMDQKKQEIYQNLRLGNSLRQTADVKLEENKYHKSYSKIHDLERAEKSMISKLGHSQTRHMQIMTDYERIMNNQEPIGPLVELQTKIDLSRSGSSTPTRGWNTSYSMDRIRPTSVYRNTLSSAGRANEILSKKPAPANPEQTFRWKPSRNPKRPALLARQVRRPGWNFY